MPINYSKWDALELSDDSDIEVHPNVDKKSFIRAKQNQIHQQRYERKSRIEAERHGITINTAMLARIDALLSSLQKHADDYKGKDGNQLMLEAMIDSTQLIKDGDKPPKLPAGVHAEMKQPESYSMMMAGIVKDVQTKMDEKGLEGDARYPAYIEGLGVHRRGIIESTKGNRERLAKFEAEERKKITSADIHDGFNTSHIKKDEPKTTTVEQINPNVKSKPSSSLPPFPRTTPVDPEEIEEEDLELTPLALQFSKIPAKDLLASRQFVFENPSILSTKTQNAILGEAFTAAMEDDLPRCRNLVHQAVLIQFCVQLGRDGARMFFSRVTNPNHESNRFFRNEVDDTYRKISARGKVLREERERDREAGKEGVEQIQLQAVEEGTVISFNIPPDPKAAVEMTEEQMMARVVFEKFPLDFQRALETGELEKVNKVLGRMGVDEAEKIVGELDATGMLSLGGGVLDATTEEGQQEWAGIQEKARLEREAGAGAPGREMEDGAETRPDEKGVSEPAIAG